MGPFLGQSNLIPVALGGMKVSALLACLLEAKVEKYSLHKTKARPQVAQTVKSLPTMQETWVRSLGQEDPLENRVATHPSIECITIT